MSSSTDTINRCWWDHHGIEDEGRMISLPSDSCAPGARFCSLECLLGFFYDKFGSSIREWERFGEFLRKQFGIDRKQLRSIRRAVTWKALKSYGGHLTIQQFRAGQHPRFLFECQPPAIQEPIFCSLQTNGTGVATLTRYQQQQQQRRAHMMDLLQLAGNNTTTTTTTSATPSKTTTTTQQQQQPPPPPPQRTNKRKLERPTHDQIETSTITPIGMVLKRARKNEMDRPKRCKDHTAREPNRLFRNNPGPKQSINTFFT